MKNHVRNPWSTVLTLLFAGMVSAWQSDAATLLVYNTHDSGPGSLRQAIVYNNLVGGGNTIIFSNVGTGTITLTSGELFISTNVTITPTAVQRSWFSGFFVPACSAF
jgi:hypothetical protein